MGSATSEVAKAMGEAGAGAGDGEDTEEEEVGGTEEGKVMGRGWRTWTDGEVHFTGFRSKLGRNFRGQGRE